MVVGGPGSGPVIPQDGRGAEPPQGRPIRPGATKSMGFC